MITLIILIIISLLIITGLFMSKIYWVLALTLLFLIISFIFIIQIPYMKKRKVLEARFKKDKKQGKIASIWYLKYFPWE